MDKTYWEKYYNLHNLTSQPSLFAMFVLENHLKKGDSLIEFGCGNGRDSVFFAHNDIDVLAIDQCENEISLLSKQNSNPKLKFQQGDFTNLGDVGMFDAIYSRFTIHSVKEEEETRAIGWSYQHLNENGKLLIEVRGKKNELYKLGEAVTGESDAYIYEDHYRRFVDMDALCQKITKTGLKIISAEEKSGFSPFKDTDYTFIRIVASK